MCRACTSPGQQDLNDRGVTEPLHKPQLDPRQQSADWQLLPPLHLTDQVGISLHRGRVGLVDAAETEHRPVLQAHPPCRDERRSGRYRIVTEYGSRVSHRRRG